jgi:hypothetical protein
VFGWLKLPCIVIRLFNMANVQEPVNSTVVADPEVGVICLTLGPCGRSFNRNPEISPIFGT